MKNDSGELLKSRHTTGAGATWTVKQREERFALQVSRSPTGHYFGMQQEGQVGFTIHPTTARLIFDGLEDGEALRQLRSDLARETEQRIALAEERELVEDGRD